MFRLSLFLFWGLLGTSLLHSQEIQSLWMNEPVSINGIPEEWPSTFRYYDGKTQLQFAIGNDTANIYVCLKISDPKTQMKIFSSGVEVWIDPKGKKNTAVGITFPIKRVRSQEEKPAPRHEIGTNPFQKSEIEKLQLRILSEQKNIKVKGFLNIPAQTLPSDNSYGITAALAWDSLNVLCIEYKMPIALTLQHSFSAKDTLKPIALGLVESAIEGNNQWHRDGGGAGAANWGSDNGSRSNTYRNQMGNAGIDPRAGSTDWNTDETEPRREFPVVITTEEQRVWNKVRLGWGR